MAKQPAYCPYQDSDEPCEGFWSDAEPRAWFCALSECQHNVPKKWVAGVVVYRSYEDYAND